jgi:predicted DNA-binding transcriptional regulator YafY
MLSAVRRRAPVRFGYRAAAASAPVERRLQPWGVVSWHGRWYAVGHDPDRGEQRVFRLSRVVGEVRPDGGDDTVVIPDGVDLAAAVRRYAEEQPIGEARLRVREGRGHDLRRGARVWPDEPGWELVELGFGDPERLADRIAAHGSDVVALAPPELRAAVLRRLRALAEQVG